MIVEPNEPLPDSLAADVCIVGGGAAGITLARELADSSLSVLLIDEGGLEPAPSDRPVYELVPGPVVELGVSPGRTFYLGGNTNHWFGNCRPLEEVDFRPRAWIPHSGWPITRDDLVPYYARAQRLAGLGSFDLYDIGATRGQLPVRARALESRVLRTRVVQTTPEFSFSRLHRAALQAATNVTVLLGCHVTAIVGDGGSRVRHVDAVRANGSRVPILADRFVLASGGIENARLLLSSTTVLGQMPPSSAGNVGRYFQEHWYYSFATHLTHRRADRRSRPLHLYDGGAGDRERAIPEFRHPVGGAHLWAQLTLAEEVAHVLKSPGLALWLTPSATPPAGIRAVKAARSAGLRPAELARTLSALVRHPVLNAEYVARKLLPRGLPSRRLTLIAQVEQVPDPENRVTLSSATDAYGRPKADLRVELGEAERRRHARALAHAAHELGLDGRALAREMEDKYRSGEFGYFWHHMGTTRMADDPSQGVVDRDCRVHGLENLYVAGSSLFPTSGTAGPTLTIVALAARLADHLRGTGARASSPTQDVDIRVRSS
jgi:choline dehydrogenase-like flavoprotein